MKRSCVPQLLLGLSVFSSVCVLSAGSPAVATPVEYVKVCSLYGEGFAYNPGTDQCINTNTIEYKQVYGIGNTGIGVISNYTSYTNSVYGVSGFAAGTNSSAFGTGAYAGGNPNGVLVIPPPVTRDPTDPAYDATYINFYDTETNNGVVNRALVPGSVLPYTNFQNTGATAVGQGAQAGAGAAGQYNATAVGQAAIANAANATAIGQGAIANAAGSVAIGQGSVATEANTVSFGTQGNERRLVNVAAGVMGTDAVNVAQLEAAVGSVAASGANTAGLGGPTATGAGAFAGGYGAVASAAGAVALGQGAQATGDPTTAVGNNAVASGNNASAFGASAVASADNSLALGVGAQAKAANSVALGVDSTSTRGAQSGYAAFGLGGGQSSAGEVSVGHPGGERQITNVAPGSASTDAVNVEQLQGAYLDARRRSDSGTAAAMAVAGLTQAVNPGKTVITGGVGTWRDQTALAFGMSHRFDNAWTFKAGGSFSTSGGSGMNASVGFEF
jgi:autotransporter adhesin